MKCKAHLLQESLTDWVDQREDASCLRHNCNRLSLYYYLNFFFFLAALGLHCCAWAFSNCGEWGPPFFAVCGLLIPVASLVEELGP